jgi:hypothetical protein
VKKADLVFRWSPAAAAQSPSVPVGKCSFRCGHAPEFRGWLTGQALLVTTADGAEYEFRGRMNGWQAGALTVRGRDVHLTPQGITVLPRATPEPG